MPLAVGARLGPYEILSALGAGGMGEVYRARDTKLGREVAIKVLPDHLAGDADRIARFEREAKALAALNHPHIATLFGLEESDGRHLLVMELVEGETLADRIARGPLPLEEAMRTAIQIADALEAAHEKAIVHRDLKPANIKRTPDATIKVLDFGLARVLEVEPAATNLTHSPTLSMMATQAGVILGTAAYMSPEQAKGLAADHRSDVFSFGVVLYEMLTGRQPFQGETAPDILASVLARDPDTSLLPTNVNPRLPELLTRCLDKNPKRRWQAIGDVRAELERIASAPRIVPGQSQRTAPVPLWKRTAPILATALIVGTLASFAGWRLKPTAPASVARFSLPLPQGQQFSNAGRRMLAISPDGKRIAYVANRQLYTRQLSELEPTPVRGTEAQGGVTNPVFSPDGLSLAFFTVGEQVLKRVTIAGGAPTTICAAENPQGMMWSSAGIFFSQASGGISRVSPDGGQPEVVVRMTPATVAYGPQLLPDGKSLLFTVGIGSDRAGDKARIVVQSLTSGERTTVIEDGGDGRYLPSGHLVFVRGGVMFAAPFDERRLVITGGPVSVVEGIRRSLGSGAGGAAHFAVSAGGSLVYVPGPLAISATQRRLMLVDRKGTRQMLNVAAGPYHSPRVSPDGRWLSVDADDGRDASIWIYSLSGASSMHRLTLTGRNQYPTWSPDSTRITFQSDREGDAGLFSQRADGTGPVARLTKSEPGMVHIPESWAPDGKTLLFAVARDAVFSLWRYSLPDGKVTPFGGVRSVYPPMSVFSPDGQWVAYFERLPERTAGSLFVQPFPGGDAKYEVSKGSGIQPLWSPDPRHLEVLYRLPSLINSVNVTTRPTFEFSKPVEVPFGPLFNAGPGFERNMDVLPDGEHFITVAADVPDATDNVATIQVVLHWFEELKQRVPVK